jgi:nucleotide-binding universal stress UspA family protein
MYKRILVPVDGSAASMSGLNEAMRLTKSGAGKLRILHVVDGVAFVDVQSAFLSDVDKYRESGKRLMQDVMARVKKKKVRAEPAIVENFSGRAADTIVKEAKKWRAEVIVMGTHGRRGFNRLVLGSDAEIVLRSAGIPVLLVQSTKTTGSRKKRRSA